MTGIFGAADANSPIGATNAINFIIWRALSRARTATPVQVLACSNTGGAAPAGTVDVQPGIMQVDGLFKPTAHAPVYGVPYYRYQSGANAIVMDPQPQDLGLLVICDRDISTWKRLAQKALTAFPWLGAAPGSRRQFSMSDGIYFGGILGAVTPTCMLTFSGGNITATGHLIVQGSSQFNGNVNVTGALAATGDVEAGGNVVANAGISAVGIIHAGGNLTSAASAIIDGNVTANNATPSLIVTLLSHAHNAPSGGGPTTAPIEPS